MKIVARAVAALALLSFAAPALPCGDMGHQKTAKTERKAETKSATVAKSGTAQKKGAATAKKTTEQRPASAAN